jgi:hypothetical protein
MIRPLLYATMITVIGAAPGAAEVRRMTHGEVQIVDIRKDGRDGKVVNVFLGNNEVAEVTPVSTTKVMITAKALGTTSMILADENHNVIAKDTIVVTYPADDRNPVRVRTFGQNHVVHLYACGAEDGCELNRVASQDGSALRAPTPAEIAAAVAASATREASPTPPSSPSARR